MTKLSAFIPSQEIADFLFKNFDDSNGFLGAKL